jgi:type IX secretion system PorP/SprF family membrane protein
MRILIFLLCLLGPYHLWAQTPVFSQFYASPTQLNAAFTGLVAAPMVQLSYRNQWPEIPQAYQTFSGTYSQYLPKLNSGFGLRLESDVMGGGIYSNIRVSALYAYDVRFNKSTYVRVGFDASLVNQRLKWNQLIFLDQVDNLLGGLNSQGMTTRETTGPSTRTYFDFSPGILVSTAYFYGGFSFRHINAPRVGFMGTADGSDALPFGLTFQFGSQIKLGKDTKTQKEAFLSPSILYVREGQNQQLHLGSYIKYGIILGGIWFRHTFTNSDAVIMMVGIQKGVFKVAYSYDLTISALNSNGGGAHEISLLFNFEGKKEKYRKQKPDCLSIFR